MSNEELMRAQHKLEQSHTSHPELREQVRRQMQAFANSTPGVIPVSSTFSYGR